jgi:hypothetical protein
MILTVLRRLREVLRDARGASMVEFTVAFPVLALVSLGTVDLGNLLYQWNAAAKATQVGARQAIVIDPVASGLENLIDDYWSDESQNYYNNIGQNCSNADGTPNLNHCPVIEVVCRGAEGTAGTCVTISGADHPFLNAPFAAIFDGTATHVGMRAMFPRLERRFVEIRYRTTGLGFAGRPNLPMEVSVSIRCLNQEFYFVDALANLITPANACEGEPAGWPIPASTTTLTAEDFSTIDPTEPSGGS